MPTATYAEASLSASERRLIDRLVELLKGQLGEKLAAVWLYGSRARGDGGPPDSDIDLLVIVSDDDTEPIRKRVRGLVEAAAGQTGSEGERWLLAPHTYSLEWLAQRRLIDAFFIQEVDRDKVVLAGGPLEEVGGDGEEIGPEELRELVPDNVLRWADKGLSVRSAEYMVLAERRLFAAQTCHEHELTGVTVGEAYGAMENAARAALSEVDVFARWELWDALREIYVLPGRLDADLQERAAATRARRNLAIYGPDPEALAEGAELDPSTQEAAETIALAEEFLAAIAEMLVADG